LPLDIGRGAAAAHALLTMKVLNQYLLVGCCPMRGACAVILCLIAALRTALSPGDTALVGERWL
jgi:hypothetical protein